MLAGTTKKRGPTRRVRDPRNKQIADRERESTRWRRRGERTEALVELPKTNRGVAGNAAGHRDLVMATVHRSDLHRRGCLEAPA
jgi:hypothetical protein